MTIPIIHWCVDWLVAAKLPNGDQENWDKQFPAIPIVCQCVDWLVAAYMSNGDWQKWDEQFLAMPIVCWQDDCWTISNFCRSIAFQTYVPGRSLINVDCCFDIWTYNTAAKMTRYWAPFKKNDLHNCAIREILTEFYRIAPQNRVELLGKLSLPIPLYVQMSIPILNNVQTNFDPSLQDLCYSFSRGTRCH